MLNAATDMTVLPLFTPGCGNEKLLVHDSNLTCETPSRRHPTSKRRWFLSITSFVECITREGNRVNAARVLSSLDAVSLSTSKLCLAEIKDIEAHNRHTRGRHCDQTEWRACSHPPLARMMHPFRPITSRLESCKRNSRPRAGHENHPIILHSAVKTCMRLLDFSSDWGVTQNGALLY